MKKNQPYAADQTSENITADIKQHSIIKSVILHLAPGIPIVLFYIFIAPIFIKAGFPPAFTLCLAVAVVLIPTQLGFLLYAGRKANGKLSLKNIVVYREKVPVPQFIIFSLIMIVWSGLSFTLLSKSAGGFIAEKFFSWAPEWFVAGNSFEGSKNVLLITWIMLMVFGNILGPVVEELYFRGYLLPRIARFKGLAPVMNSVLFAAYHFWSPWEFVTRAVAVFPVCFIAYKKKNIYIGITAHLLLNILSSLPLLAVIFA